MMSQFIILFFHVFFSLDIPISLVGLWNMIVPLSLVTHFGFCFFDWILGSLNLFLLFPFGWVFCLLKFARVSSIGSFINLKIT